MCKRLVEKFQLIMPSEVYGKIASCFSFLILLSILWASAPYYYCQLIEEMIEGIPQECYDQFHDLWPQYVDDCTHYMDFDNLQEFLASLYPPLQIDKPNKYIIVHHNIPIYR